MRSHSTAFAFWSQCNKTKCDMLLCEETKIDILCMCRVIDVAGFREAIGFVQSEGTTFQLRRF